MSSSLSLSLTLSFSLSLSYADTSCTEERKGDVSLVELTMDIVDQWIKDVSPLLSNSPQPSQLPPKAVSALKNILFEFRKCCHVADEKQVERERESNRKKQRETERRGGLVLLICFLSLFLSLFLPALCDTVPYREE